MTHFLYLNGHRTGHVTPTLLFSLQGLTNENIASGTYTIQYNTIQYNTLQYNTIQYNTTQHNTIQYNTIQYITIQIFTQGTPFD